MTNEEICRFFSTQPVNILGNERLRLPQLQGYVALHTALASSATPARYHVQIPVGGGKTGLMGLVPFRVARGRVLIVAPDLTVRRNVKNELDISNPDSFYVGRGVLTPPFRGPYVTELGQDANTHDCSDAHIVIANIQQFVGSTSRWYEQLAPDFFALILVDEGHHNVAPSWQRLFEYFRYASVVSFTGMPDRADSRTIDGLCVYRFSYTQSALMALTSPVESALVSPTDTHFTHAGSLAKIPVDDLRKMNERDWASRQIALNQEANRQIVETSLNKLREARRHASARRILASVCSKHHAAQVQALYHERGHSSAVVHGDMPEDSRGQLYERVRQGSLDVLVEVQTPDESPSISTFAVAAIFRPFNSLSAYMRLVRWVLPLAEPMYPYSSANKVHVVSQAGLNSELRWDDFAECDAGDQAYFAAMVNPRRPSPAKGTNLTLFSEDVQPQGRPPAEIISEVVDRYRLGGDFKAIDDALIDRAFGDLRQRGFKPEEHGLTEDVVRQRLRQVAQVEHGMDTSIVQPQRRREALRMALHQQSLTMTEIVLDRLSLAANGKDLAGIYPDNAHMTNVQVVVSHIKGSENAIMEISKKQRADASVNQLQSALDAGPAITQEVAALLGDKLAFKRRGR